MNAVVYEHIRTYNCLFVTSLLYATNSISSSLPVDTTWKYCVIRSGVLNCQIGSLELSDPVLSCELRRLALSDQWSCVRLRVKIVLSLYCIVFIHFYGPSHIMSLSEALSTTAIDT